MGCGADLLLMRETARLPLATAAKCLSIGSFELRLLEQKGSGITDKMLAAVRAVYRLNARSAPPEPVAPEYIPGVEEAAMCTHHWDLEPPSGPTSEGVCRDCGSVRTFRNSGIKYYELAD